jgi:hypothetical protein
MSSGEFENSIFTLNSISDHCKHSVFMKKHYYINNDKLKHTLPIDLPGLLSYLAIDNTIIVTAGTYQYKDILLPFICNLKKLRVTNYIIFAMDNDLYEYLLLRSVPVVMINLKNSLLAKLLIGFDLTAHECSIFRSPCYRLITKLKSVNVLEVLKLGYNVS